VELPPGVCPTAHFDASRLGVARRREAKGPLFQPPVIQRQPIAVPPQQLDPIAAATAEDEQVAR
jgi:hypothetical protein